MAPVTSARGLAETDSSEGGAAAENQTELLKHEWHHSRGTSARRADRVHNPGTSNHVVAHKPSILAGPHLPFPHPAATFPKTPRRSARRRRRTRTPSLGALPSPARPIVRRDGRPFQTVAILNIPNEPSPIPGHSAPALASQLFRRQARAPSPHPRIGVHPRSALPNIYLPS
jgi:hypothetical protein